MLAAGLALMVAGCKKDKESAVIEEVPAAAPPAETDTSATLAEEPNLQQVGKDKPGSAKSTFHPSGKGNAAPATGAGLSESGRFVVQVSIFKSKRQAAGLVEKLAGQGYPAYVAEVQDPVPELSGTYHRVRIGKFQTLADARSFGENTLKPLGYDFWVDNKKNDGMGGSGGYSAPVSEPVEPAAEAPRKVKKAKAAEPAVSETSTPPGGTWETPKAEEPVPAAPSEPATAAKAPATELPGTKAAAPSAPAEPAKPDTGKVNLDEW